MAEKSQLDLLLKGVRHWNQWRSSNPDSVIDLTNATLRDVDLTGVDLTNADLFRADLRGAKLGTALEDLAYLFEAFGVPGAPKSLAITSLRGAQLREADISGAQMIATDLRGADLRDADLSLARIVGQAFEPGQLFGGFRATIPANLGGAKLDGAVLYRTRFESAVLNAVSFAGAQIAGTQFFSIDLSRAEKLNSVRHLSQASFDIATLELTAAGLEEKPDAQIEAFLRDAGLPREYSEPFRLRTTGGRFYSCFISHSSRDDIFCRKLYHRMKSDGFRVWYAEEDIRGGQTIYEQITKAIESHDKLLLVLSEESMRSRWVELEIRAASKLEKEAGRRLLFPLSLVKYDRIRDWQLVDSDHGEDLAVKIREYFIPDFSAWKDEDAFEEAFQKLASDLQASDRERRGLDQ